MNAPSRFLAALVAAGLSVLLALPAQAASPAPTGAWATPGPARGGAGAWAQGSSPAAPLPADQAFVVRAATPGQGAGVVDDTGQLAVELAPHPGYEIYRDTVRVSVDGHAVDVELPVGTASPDPVLGTRGVFDGPVHLQVPVGAGARAAGAVVEVAFQGCKPGVVCYPPMRWQVARGGAAGQWLAAFQANGSGTGGSEAIDSTRTNPGLAGRPLAPGAQARGHGVGPRLPTWALLPIVLGAGLLAWLAAAIWRRVQPGEQMSLGRWTAGGAVAMLAGGLLAWGLQAGGGQPAGLAVAPGSSPATAQDPRPAPQPAPVFTPVESLAGLDAALARAGESGDTVVLDLYADWCAACQKMERKTFSTPAVRQGLGGQGVVALKVDLSDNSDGDQAIMRQLGVVGLPATLFFRNGRERRDLRLMGFEADGAFLERVLLASCQHAPGQPPAQAC